MSDIYIKVTTEELISKAQLVRYKVAYMEKELCELDQLLNNTAQYWLGDGGDKKRNDFKKERQMVEEIIRRLKEYPEDLMQMAGIYVDAERQNAERPASLPTDFIL